MKTGLDQNGVRWYRWYHFLPMRVVLDTNVLVAAARSRQGASFALLSLIPSGQFEFCISVSLYAEWQDVLLRAAHVPPGLAPEDVLGFLRYLASQARLQEIYFLWCPFLPDADDDMVLELAFASHCRYIITHNLGDFRGSEQFGITALSPRDFLKLLRGTP